MICMAEKRKKVSRKVLKKATAALRSYILFTPRFHTGSAALSWKWIRPLTVFGACAMILILIGISGYQGWLGDRVQNFTHSLYSPIMTSISVQQSGTESVAKTGIPPAAAKSDARNAAKLPDAAINTPSGIEGSRSKQIHAGKLYNENNLKSPPKTQRKRAKKSVSSSGNAMQPSEQQAPNNIDYGKDL
jgi:hypothetical protein